MTGKDHAIPFRDSRPGGLALSYSLVRECLDFGLRKGWTTAERIRMARVRSRPGELLRALRSASSILVVCHGNIIRSPFAAAVLRTLLGPATTITVRSAGVEALPGRAAHPVAQRIADSLHIDLSRHAAAPLTRELIEQTDVIFVVDALQLVAIRRRFPGARAKTFLLACLSPSVPLEIRDPIEGDENVFVSCCRHIVYAVRPIARVLSERASPLKCGPSKA